MRHCTVETEGKADDKYMGTSVSALSHRPDKYSIQLYAALVSLARGRLWVGLFWHTNIEIVWLI